MRGGKRGIYLFYGEDDFSREEAVRRLLSQLLPAASLGTAQLNLEIYDGKEDDHGLFGLLDTLPFSSAKRVIVIKNAESLSEAGKNSLAKYIKNPPEHLILIFDCGARTIESQFMKMISSAAAPFFFKKPKGPEITRWIHDRLRPDKKAMTRSAIDLLLELKGEGDLACLAAEIEKLTVFTGTKRTIDKDDVALVVDKSADSTAFNLASAVSAKDKEAALSIMRELSSGVRRLMPEMIIGAIGWRLKLLWKGKALLSRYRDKNRVLSELRIKPPDREAFLRQANSLRTDQLKRDFRLLVDADRRIKTGRQKPEFVLEELVIRLCGA